MSLRDFKGTFSSSQKDALWQYFVDHSQVQPNGYLGLMFYVKNIDDFFERLYARATGEYKRYEVQDKETRQMNKEKMFSELVYFRKIARRNSNTCDRILKSGTLIERIHLLVYRKTRDYLFK